MTIMLTNHYLDEADSIAARVAVLEHGKVIADDTAEASTELAGMPRVGDALGAVRPRWIRQR